jgi:cell wall-associated NlpC family hydrolase
VVDAASVLRDQDSSAGEKASSLAASAAGAAAEAAATAATGNVVAGKAAGAAASKVAGSRGFRYVMLAGVAAVLASILVMFAVVSSIAETVAQATVLNPAVAKQDDLMGVGGGITNVPAEYVEIVLRAGSICPEITAPILASQINQESHWNPSAGSTAGARGIAQFMPATWSAVGKDGDGDGRADILNPIDAIWTQGNYMCGLVAQIRAWQSAGEPFVGSPLELALAAYNAGSGAVRTYHGIPPYAETQHYVAAIIAGATAYEMGGGGISRTGDLQADAIAAAKTKIGKPYIWAAEGPDSFDCSGLVTWAYRQAGVELPHQSAQQSQVTAHVPWSKAQPGDLIFWAHGKVIYHVAIYLGGSKMIEAPQPGSTVHVTTIWGTPLNYVGRVNK